jgi:hypothetical protein
MQVPLPIFPSDVEPPLIPGLSVFRTRFPISFHGLDATGQLDLDFAGVRGSSSERGV